MEVVVAYFEIPSIVLAVLRKTREIELVSEIRQCDIRLLLQRTSDSCALAQTNMK